MLYIIKENYTNKLELLKPIFKFKFKLKNIIHIGDYSSNNLLNLEKYFPSTSEQSELLQEYTTWCSTFSQEQNENLIRELSNVDYWKEAKLDILETATDLFEQSKNNDMYFTSSLGFRVNGDRRSLTNITSLIEYFDVKQQDGTIGFKDYDNVIDKVTKEQLQTIKAELVTNSENLYAQKWAYQDRINSAESLDDLNAIEIKFDMMDFTPESDDSGASIQSDSQDVVQTLATLLGKGV